MNDVEAPNPALRAHVTEQSFVLTLGRTHIRALGYLMRCYTERKQSPWEQSTAQLIEGREETRGFVTAMCGLKRRGLVEHRHRPNFKGKSGGLSDPLSDYYRLTRAGFAVYDLLAEAGMVAVLDKRSPKRRLVA